MELKVAPQKALAYDSSENSNTPVIPSVQIDSIHSTDETPDPLSPRSSEIISNSSNNVGSNVSNNDINSVGTSKTSKTQTAESTIPSRRHTTILTSTANAISIPNDEKETLRTYVPSKVKETRHVYVEYDPISHRKVLNTYEILKNLGRGQHGKVKLARDMISNQLVLIKIVDRKSKARLGKQLAKGGSQEDKIKKEIAIMKKCDHPHVVKLIEVLDDVNSRKIYLVLEYLEKGEIKWQQPGLHKDEPSPVLRFHQVQKIFRDVVSGLEYLHYQGIIHRDIKPANLLISHDDVVKISDFGVSFASSLEYNNNELDLCKTAGTPAFLAPELCRTDVLSQETDLKVDHKIDIWALGVTLFCLLFGRLPFYADSEFKLFEVINKEPLQIPPKSVLVESEAVSQDEWELLVDLLTKLLTKDPQRRIDIPEIKQHDFFLYDLSPSEVKKYFTGNDVIKLYVSNEEVHQLVVGIGNKIKKKLLKAFRRGFVASPDETHLIPEPSPVDSLSSSSKPSTTRLNSSARSLILSELLSPEFSGTDERRGSLDLIETRESLEGTFRRPSNDALAQIRKLGSPQPGADDGNNSFLRENSSRKGSVVKRSSPPASPGNLRFNASFASLDSLHGDDLVLDVSSYVPVSFQGDPGNTVKFHNVDFQSEDVVRRQLDDLEPKAYEPKAYDPNYEPRAYSRNDRRSSYSTSSCSSSRSTSANRSSLRLLSRQSTLASGRRKPTLFSFSAASSSDDDSDREQPFAGRVGAFGGCSDADDDDDDDDNKELTFLFVPKTESRFLRALSQNSIQQLRPASMSNLSAIYDQSEYVMPSCSSTVDLPEEFQSFIPELGPSSHGSSPLKHETSSLETLKTGNLASSSKRVSSPLALNAPLSSKATLSAHLFTDQAQRRNFDAYKNHYSKDNNVIPFANAHHLGNGNETSTTTVTLPLDRLRDRLHRHNSITIGLLQNRK